MCPARALAIITCVVLLGTLSTPAALAALPRRAERLLARPDAWRRGSVVGIGHLRTGTSAPESAANLLSFYYR